MVGSGASLQFPRPATASFESGFLRGYARRTSSLSFGAGRPTEEILNYLMRFFFVFFSFLAVKYFAYLCGGFALLFLNLLLFASDMRIAFPELGGIVGLAVLTTAITCAQQIIFNKKSKKIMVRLD